MRLCGRCVAVRVIRPCVWLERGRVPDGRGQMRAGRVDDEVRLESAKSFSAILRPPNALVEENKRKDIFSRTFASRPRLDIG